MSNDEDKNRVKMAKAVRELLDNWPAHLEFIRFQAKETRARYVALMAEGFTESQAIDLCKRP